MAEQITILTKEEVLNHLENGSAVVVDVLGRPDYDKVHIKGSVSIPLDLLEQGELEAIGDSKNVITYCKSYTCGASKNAAVILKGMGYNAMAYEGGIEEWENSGLPVEGTKVSH